MRSTARLALYTTIYPGVEKFLTSWYDSVLKQKDRNFDLWIGIDSLDIEHIIDAIGATPYATMRFSKRRETPAQIRQRIILEMINNYDGIIFVDSDDILYPSRVEAARDALVAYDVYGCAMNLVDEYGNNLDSLFGIPANMKTCDILPKHNVFGLSNTAYRSEILKRCLPIPDQCVIVDWFLAINAWSKDAKMYFDPECRMHYRQYTANVARILPPFTEEYILNATKMVFQHFNLLLPYINDLKSQHLLKVDENRMIVSEFFYSIKNSKETLCKYLQALNEIMEPHIWWDIVAHPKLEALWRR